MTLTNAMPLGRHHARVEITSVPAVSVDQFSVRTTNKNIHLYDLRAITRNASNFMIDPATAQRVLKALTDEDRDLYFYSGSISATNVAIFHNVIEQARSRERSRASLVLTTLGGDAHQAFRLARLFKSHYPRAGARRLVVVGPCKSAGTLIAVSADELAMGPLGELGPLDVQLAKQDEIAVSTSGLDTLEALAVLQRAAFEAFETYMVTIVNRSNGRVSTKTACDIAATIVSGVFRPIAGKIDPLVLAQADRRMRIALAYGKRLRSPNLIGEHKLVDLVRSYPSHGFVIDRVEAERIFERVHGPSEAEESVLGLQYPTGQNEEVVRDVVQDLDSLVRNAAQASAELGSPS